MCGLTPGAQPRFWTYRLGDAAARLFVPLPSIHLRVAGCSFQRDLALVVGYLGGQEGPPLEVSDVWWIRLHDGAIPGHKVYSRDAASEVVASPDLSLFAENFAAWPRPPGGPPMVTSIRRTWDGSLVATRSDIVTGFSGDDSKVATLVFNGGPVGVFTFSDRQVWRADIALTEDIYPNAGGDDFLAVIVSQKNGLVDQQQLGLELVGPDGSAAAIDTPPVASVLPPG